MTTGAPLVAAAEALVAAAAPRDPWLAELRLDGIGWATVELERAAEDLGAAFKGQGALEPRWMPGARDDLLGATTWISRENWDRAAADPPPALVLLEPDTEGRLAATLARFGEGVGAVYLCRRSGAEQVDGGRLGRPAPGPLGPARLVLAQPAWGPSLLVLDR